MRIKFLDRRTIKIPDFYQKSKNPSGWFETDKIECRYVQYVTKELVDGEPFYKIYLRIGDFGGSFAMKTHLLDEESKQICESLLKEF